MFTGPLSGFPIWSTDSRFNWLYRHLSRWLISEPSVRLCASLCKTTVGIISICCFFRRWDAVYASLLVRLSFHAWCFTFLRLYLNLSPAASSCLCAFYFIIKGKNKSLFSAPFIPRFGSSTAAIPFWRRGFPLQSCDLKRPCKVKPRLKKCAGCLAGILSAKEYLRRGSFTCHARCDTADLFAAVTCDVLYIPSTRSHDLFIMLWWICLEIYSQEMIHFLSQRQ